jgi:Rifampin ADP-ribosyl transferase
MTDPTTPSTPPDTGSRRFYHGTRAALTPGDLLQPGYSSNYTDRQSPWVYFSETLDAATVQQALPGRSVDLARCPPVVL